MSEATSRSSRTAGTGSSHTGSSSPLSASPAAGAGAASESAHGSAKAAASAAAAASPPLPAADSSEREGLPPRGQGKPQQQQKQPPPVRAPSANGEDLLQDIRQTHEYRAAWDLEVWKSVQAERFLKQLEAQRARALAELARSVKAREAAALAAAERKSDDLRVREERLVAAEAQLQGRQQRVVEMDRDLRRTRQDLLEAQRRVEEEVRAQVRRANAEMTHRCALLQERLKASEAQTQRAEERQRQSQAQYLALYEDFHRFRTQVLTAPGGGAGLGCSSGGALAQREAERARAAAAEEFRLREERLVQRYEQQLSDAARERQALAEENCRLAAALARRREQLASLRRTPADAPLTATAPATAPASTASASASAVPRVVASLVQELARLERERSQLVEGSAGAVTPDDPIIARLDERRAAVAQEITRLMGPH